MLNANHFEDIEVTLESNEPDERSLQDIELTMEDTSEIIHSMNSEISVLSNINSNESVSAVTLEDASAMGFTMEDYTTSSAKGLILGDYSPVYRLFQKVTDKIRDNRANVKAYRKKTEKSMVPILARINSKESKGSDFTVQLAGILPYLTRASDAKDWDSAPTAILKILQDDNSDIAEFIATYPKAVIGELKKVEGILKAFKGKTSADFERQVVSKVESLTHPMDLIKGITFSRGDVYLARTIFLTTFDPKSLKKDGLTKLEILGKDFKLDMIDTRSPEDNRRIVEAFIPIVGPILTSARMISSPFWKLTPDEAKDVIKGQEKVIDNAEAVLDANISFNDEITKVLKSIDELTPKFKDVDGSIGTEVKLIEGYISNLTKAHRTFFTKLADRQIRLARGLNLVLVRLKHIGSN